jgi:site-specific recombinase XerD
MMLIPKDTNEIAPVRHYIEQALSDNTHKAFRNDMDHFFAWGGQFPATPDMIAAYLAHHAETYTVATLRRRLASLSKAHNIAGYNNPVSSQLVKMTMRGIARTHGKPQRQVAVLLKEDLTVMLSHAPDGLKGHRDKALLILGFCAALRRSELCAIKFEDLEFNAQGMVLTLPRSKTDQTGQGRKIGIPFGRGKICPVRLVKNWIDISGIQSSSLFVSIRKGRMITGEQLSDRSIANIIKLYAAKAGLEAEKYSGHSLRSGLCSSAAQHGVSSWKIKAQSGHKSDATLARYIRMGDLFTDNAAGALF